MRLLEGKTRIFNIDNIFYIREPMEVSEGDWRTIITSTGYSEWEERFNSEIEAHLFYVRAKELLLK